MAVLFEAGMIVFSCPNCGNELRVLAVLAGRRGRCPHCKSKTRVPDAAGAEVKEDPPSPTAAPAFQDAAVAAILPDDEILLTGDDDSGPPHKTGTKKTPPDPAAARAALIAKLTAFLDPPRGANELGRLGKYRVLRVLGAGGMGVVFAGEDTSLKRSVALKALRPEMSANRTARDRFLREAQATAALQHDNIITVYEVGQAKNVPYMAMQLLRGETLEDRLARSALLPVGEVLRIGCEAAEGLAAAHETGLVHRDIKPANLFLEGKKRRVKILDFGLAYVDDGESKLTQLGIVVGTVGYLSPEQAGSKLVDARSDLFGLGCVLYRLTTGELPFKGGDLISKLNALANTEPMPPNCLNEHVPEVLSDLIMMLLDKDPNYRPGSARDVAQALDSLSRRALRREK